MGSFPRKRVGCFGRGSGNSNFERLIVGGTLYCIEPLAEAPVPFTTTATAFATPNIGGLYPTELCTTGTLRLTGSVRTPRHFWMLHTNCRLSTSRRSRRGCSRSTRFVTVTFCRNCAPRMIWPKLRVCFSHLDPRGTLPRRYICVS